MWVPCAAVKVDCVRGTATRVFHGACAPLRCAPLIARLKGLVLKPEALRSTAMQRMQLPAGDEPPELRRRLEHALLMNMIQDPDVYLSPEPFAQQVRLPEPYGLIPQRVPDPLCCALHVMLVKSTSGLVAQGFKR